MDKMKKRFQVKKHTVNENTYRGYGGLEYEVDYIGDIYVLQDEEGSVWFDGKLYSKQYVSGLSHFSIRENVNRSAKTEDEAWEHLPQNGVYEVLPPDAELFRVGIALSNSSEAIMIEPDELMAIRQQLQSEVEWVQIHSLAGEITLLPKADIRRFRFEHA